MSDTQFEIFGPTLKIMSWRMELNWTVGWDFLVKALELPVTACCRCGFYIGSERVGLVLTIRINSLRAAK